MPMPHSLSTLKVGAGLTPAQKKDLAGWVGRHAPYQKGDVLQETTALECPRVRVADLPEGFLKKNHIERLEQNQLIASCCRHPENHDVEAFKSHPEEQAPDIYIFHCTCGRKHRFLCVGMGDERPSWKA